MFPSINDEAMTLLLLQVLRVCVRLILQQGVSGATLEGRAQENLQEINR